MRTPLWTDVSAVWHFSGRRSTQEDSVFFEVAKEEIEIRNSASA
jgi:hypothetical protein